MKKYIFFIIIFMLTIGFASVSVNLVLSGKTSVAFNQNNLQVIFKRVRLNNEESENIVISEDGKSFVYIADDLVSVGDTSNIEYDIKNQSSNYDASVVVSCTTDNGENIEYTGNTLNQLIEVSADEGYTDTLTTKLTKVNNTSNSLALKCTLIINPIERDTIMLGKEYNITFDANGGSTIDESVIVSYYEKYGELPIPIKKGYEFLGWYTESGEKIDSSSLVKIKDNHTLIAKWKEICSVGDIWNFDYTGNEQEFTVPCAGEYKLETWGAQGGSYDSTYYGGYGAYSVGNITLYNKDSIFINVGETGNIRRNNTDSLSISGGYNGGGDAKDSWTGTVNSSFKIYNISGGGATSISLKSGLLENLEVQKDKVIIVAAGGGGAQYFVTSGDYVYFVGGHGGGITGSIAKCNGSRLINYITVYNTATQEMGARTSYINNIRNASFGKGATGYSGGGGGYYGGAGNYCVSGGGSSYIGNTLLANKTMYCYNCDESNEESTKTISVNTASLTPIANTPKQGNGHARITLVSIN